MGTGDYQPAAIFKNATLPRLNAEWRRHMALVNSIKPLFILAAAAVLLAVAGALAFVVIAAWGLAAWFGENAPLAERALDSGIALWLLLLNGGNALLAIIAGTIAFRRHTRSYTDRRRKWINYAVWGTGFLALLLTVVIAAMQGYLGSAVMVGFFPLLLAGVAVRNGVHLAGKVDYDRPYCGPYWLYGLAMGLPTAGLAASAVVVAMMTAVPALADMLGIWLLLANGTSAASAATALLATAALPGLPAAMAKSGPAWKWLAGGVPYVALAHVAAIVIFYGPVAESIIAFDDMHQLRICAVWVALSAYLAFAVSLNRAGRPVAQTMAGALACATALTGALFYASPLGRGAGHPGDWCALASASVALLTLLAALGLGWRRTAGR